MCLKCITFALIFVINCVQSVPISGGEVIPEDGLANLLLIDTWKIVHIKTIPLQMLHSVLLCPFNTVNSTKLLANIRINIFVAVFYCKFSIERHMLFRHHTVWAICMYPKMYEIINFKLNIEKKGTSLE